jgi:peroxiredoxin
MLPGEKRFKVLDTEQKAPHFEAKPTFGLHFSLNDACRERPLVLIFVPSLGSAISRACLAQVQEMVSAFDLAGVGLVGLTRSTLRATQDFVPRYHLRFPLIADPQGAIFSQYGVDRLGLKQALNSLRLGALKQGIQALRFGVGLPEKALFWPPAAFAIAQGGLICHTHISRSLVSTLPLPLLLTKAESAKAPKPKSR